MEKKDKKPFDLLSGRIRGDMLRGYSTALEGWRRGLNLQIKVDYSAGQDEGIEYILDDGETSHHFKGSRGDFVSQEAVDICSDKETLRGYLHGADVKIPDGKIFDEGDTVEGIWEYVKKAGYPLAVKKVDGNLFKDIHNDEDMKQAIESFQDKMEGHKIIVERSYKEGGRHLYVVGESVFNITDDPLDEETKKLALKAVKSIPGLFQGSVRINADKDSEENVVIDVRPDAYIKKHEGLSDDAARDVPSAIIDYYFPETKEYNREEAARLYFDFGHVYDSSKRGKSGYVEIPKIPEDIGLTRFILIADRFPKSFLGWIQSTAVKHGVSGTARRLSDRKISLVLGGNRADVNAFTILLRKKCRRFKHTVKFTRKKRITPVMQGFNVIQDTAAESTEVKSLKKENKRLKKEMAALKKAQSTPSGGNYKKLTRRLSDMRKKGK
ncbi:hypothetical protein ACBR55_04005 [Salinicoccus roseus]|uniref:hypothetical protein n=1 Tax=Salinicoccus roseus TaxID=45670 RepID=UPI003524D6CB